MKDREENLILDRIKSLKDDIISIEEEIKKVKKELKEKQEEVEDLIKKQEMTIAERKLLIQDYQRRLDELSLVNPSKRRIANHVDNKPRFAK